MMADTITLDVARYRPGQEAEPTLQSYDVPLRDDWVVLDGLNYVKDELDGTLSYRWSCRMGICGSCGMTVNGEPKLTFPHRIRAGADPGRAAGQLPGAAGPRRRHRRLPRQALAGQALDRPGRGAGEGSDLQTPEELEEFRQYSMCINCMLYHSACPVYGIDEEFVGPAAIALAQRYNLDSRDEGAADRLDVLIHPDGIWGCTFVGDCTRVCPKHVDPAGAIQRYKLTAAMDTLKSYLLPGAADDDRSFDVVRRPPPAYRPRMSLWWWLSKWSYLLFVLRELSSVFVAWFVVFLLLFVRAVYQGDDQYQDFLSWAANPFVVLVNVVALAFLLLHTVTWFGLTPQAVPARLRGGGAVVGGGLAVRGLGGGLGVRLLAGGGLVDAQTSGGAVGLAAVQRWRCGHGVLSHPALPVRAGISARLDRASRPRPSTPVLGHPLTRIVLLGLCVLGLVHWAHRFRYTLHEGLQLGRVDNQVAIVCYGAAVVGSVAAAYVLLFTG